MTESKRDPAVLREEARQRYIEAIKDFHQSLLVAAEKNAAVVMTFNECCLQGVTVIAAHWNDLDPNPLSNGRVTQWSQAISHNLNVTL